MKKKCNVDPSYVKSDGSLDIDYLNTISIGKFTELFPMLTQEQVDEFWAKSPQCPGPTKAIMINEEFDADLEEKHTRYRKYRHEDIAATIADHYLKKSHRGEFVLVKLCSTREASMGEFYKEVTSKEKDFIRKWEDYPKNSISLDEYISTQDSDLYQRLVSNESLYALDMIESIDVNDVRKYSQCQIREYDQTCDNYKVYTSTFPLSDDEFRELLIDRICTYRSLTMNSVVIYHPILAQKIMKHLICLTGMETENYYHFIVIFTEIDNAFNEIIRTKTELSMELQNYIGFRKIIG